MGAVTGKGLADLIRERFGVRWTALVMLALLVANAGVTVSEFVGIAAATELFGVSRFVSVPMAAILIWWLGREGFVQESRASVSVDVARLSRLHRFRFSLATRLERSRRRSGQARVQARTCVSLHFRRRDRYDDLAVHAGVRSIVGGREKA